MIKRLLILLLLLMTVAPVSAAAPSKMLSLSVDHGINLTLGTPAASVFIANPDVADIQVMSPTSIMIFGKRTGETTFMATDNAGRVLEQRTINVVQDLSSLRYELDQAFPTNKIRAESVPNGIILTGDARDATAVTDAYKIAMRYLPSGGDIINRIRLSGSNQIQIRVRFAEVQRTLNNSLGFNWENLANVGGFAFGIASGVTGVGSGAGILGTRPNNTTLATPNDVIGISRTGGHYNVNALIDALAQDGLITILAEPNLTAMSGETANFLAGGQFPIPIPQGNGTISIQFQSYGVSLAFTPTLLTGDRISLHVKPEVSELSTAGAITLGNTAVPALTVRRAETTVEVASGQSFAIAGLLDNSQTQTVNKYPLLGDLPVLGALFRSDQFQSGQTELVIIITPYVVKPSGEQLALPTDGFSPPSESDRLLGLRYSASDPNARPMSGAPTAVKAEPPTVAATPLAPVTSSAPVTAPIPAMPMALDNSNAEPAPKTMTNIALKPQMPDPQPVSSNSTAIISPPAYFSPGTPAPVNTSPSGIAPAAAGGFILE